MNRAHSRQHSASASLAALALFAGLALSLSALSGCDRESDESKQVRAAANRVENITGSGAASPSASRANIDYPSVASTLTGAGKAAAPIIVAQTQLGQADVAIGEA